MIPITFFILILRKRSKLNHSSLILVVSFEHPLINFRLTFNVDSVVNKACIDELYKHINFWILCGSALLLYNNSITSPALCQQIWGPQSLPLSLKTFNVRLEGQIRPQNMCLLRETERYRTSCYCRNHYSLLE